MRTVSLLLTLVVATFAARAIAQEIVIEPTNGRAPSANHSRPAAMPSMPMETRKPAAKSEASAGPERSATTKSAKKATVKQVSARRKTAPVETSPSPSTVPDAVKSDPSEVLPAARKKPARPEWAMTDTRDAHSLQTEIASALAHDPKLASSSIQVNVDDGAVTLEGQAAGAEERLQAHRLAQSYGWNRKLVDHIEIVRPVSAQK